MNFFVDDKHPTIEGSYLSACCLYSTIYKKSLQNLFYVADLKSDLAHKLQGVAVETMEVEIYDSASANREPRIKIAKDNKNYVSETVYDNSRIREDNLVLNVVDGNGIQNVIITTIPDSNGNYTNLMTLKETDVTSGYKASSKCTKQLKFLLKCYKLYK